jgi:hypothetical protein
VPINLIKIEIKKEIKAREGKTIKRTNDYAGKTPADHYPDHVKSN